MAVVQVYTTNCQTLEDQVASQAQRTDSVTAKEDARQCSQAQVSDLKRSLQASGQVNIKLAAKHKRAAEVPQHSI